MLSVYRYFSVGILGISIHQCSEGIWSGFHENRSILRHPPVGKRVCFIQIPLANRFLHVMYYTENITLIPPNKFGPNKIFVLVEQAHRYGPIWTNISLQVPRSIEIIHQKSENLEKSKFKIKILFGSKSFAVLPTKIINTL